MFSIAQILRNLMRILQLWQFYSIKRISQHFLDCGFRNDKFAKNSPRKNFGLRAAVENLDGLEIY
jgi:hypothetical protein